MKELVDWMKMTGQYRDRTANDFLPSLLKKIHVFQRCLDSDRKKLSVFARERFFSKCRVEAKLDLKEDAQVMLLTNEDLKAGLANGSRGKVVEMVDTAAYIEAFNEEGRLRSNLQNDFSLRKRKLDSDRLLREDALRRDQGLSAEEARTSVDEWYSRMSDALKQELDSQKAVEHQLHGVSARVSAVIKNLNEDPFLEEQRRLDSLNAGKWPVVPLVRFMNGMERIFTPRSFAVEWTSIGYAVRKQFPLKKAWAISIHKSQGMTIDWLEVDCSRIFTSGQVYVALSRGRGREQMAVRNLDMSKVRASSAVAKFYDAMATDSRPAANYRRSGGSIGFKLLRNREMKQV